MTETIHIPTGLEIKNADKILLLLSKIDGISYEQQPERQDIFVVHEEDSDLKLIIDVEEDTVVSFMEITSYEGNLPEGLAEKLLEMNHGAVHGAFTTKNGKLYFKSNLQIEHIDLNEIEASIRSCFLTVYNNIETINEYFSE